MLYMQTGYPSNYGAFSSATGKRIVYKPRRIIEGIHEI